MLTFKSYSSSSAGNVNIISDGVTALMLDCGLPLKKIRQKGIKVSGLAGCLISHSHQDHCKGAEALAKAACDVYMLPDTREALNLNGHRVHEIWPLQTTTIGTFKVTPFLVKHDVQCCGFILESGEEKAVYLTDAAYTEYTFGENLTILSIECNYNLGTLRASKADPARKKRVMMNHFGLDNVIKLLQANDLSNLREIHLLHLSDENSNEAEIKREVQKITGVPCYVAKA